METELAPEPEGIEPGGETYEVSPDESPPDEFAAPLDEEEFNARVNRLMDKMKEDPDVRDRVLAEIYVNMASAEMGIRGVAEMVRAQGIGGLMRSALRRG